MHKFNKVDSRRGPAHWGPIFCGDQTLDLSLRESRLRDQILLQTMTKARARRVLDGINGETPWYSKADFIESLAALSSTFSAEVSRRLHLRGVTIKRLISNLSAPDKMGWYFNNLRYRHTIPLRENALLGSGTTQNEALHFQLNKYFGNQPEWYSTTAELQLGIFALAKQLAHNCALYNPTLTQMVPALVLTRRVALLDFPQHMWVSFTKELQLGDGAWNVQPASTPLFNQRKRLAARIKAHVYKRPSGKRSGANTKRPRSNTSMTRTAFTLRRRLNDGYDTRNVKPFV